MHTNIILPYRNHIRCDFESGSIDGESVFAMENKAKQNSGTHRFPTLGTGVPTGPQLVNLANVNNLGDVP